MSGPFPVGEFFRKAAVEKEPADQDPDSSRLKLMVVSSDSTEDETAVTWLLDEAVKYLEENAHAEVGRFSLGRLTVHPCVGCYGGGGRVCMHPCDRNDLESDIYQPNDQMQTLYDHMIESDILLVASDVRAGGLSHQVQRFLERLAPFHNQIAAGKPLLKNKVAGVIVVGESQYPGLPMALQSIGYTIPRFAVVNWHIPRAAPADQVRAAFERAKPVHDNLRLLATSLRDFATNLKGA